jgi:hypothetical protein
MPRVTVLQHPDGTTTTVTTDTSGTHISTSSGGAQIGTAGRGHDEIVRDLETIAIVMFAGTFPDDRLQRHEP